MEQTLNLKAVYQALKDIQQKMVTKEELGEALETVAVLSNPKTMRQIADSEEDIRAGRFKRISSVRDF